MGEECTALKEMPISLWILPDSKYSCEEEEETYKERERDRASEKQKERRKFKKGGKEWDFFFTAYKKGFWQKD